MDEQIKQYIVFQINRKIRNLSKNFLEILEDTRDDVNNSPSELYARGRKRVLDRMNDLIRELEDEFKNLNITLK